MKPLLRFAIVTLVGFAALHVLGFREDAGFLSGTRVGSTAFGVVYVLSYFAAVVAAPVAMIAAALLWMAGGSTSSRRLTDKASASRQKANTIAA